jgi:hypothetical protein
VKLDDILNKESSSLDRGNRLGGGNEVSHLGSSVHGDQNRIVGVIQGELGNKIDGDGTPWYFGNRKRHEKAVGEMARLLVALADLAGGDKSFDCFPHSFPSEVSGDQLEGFGDTKVSTKRLVVSGFHNLTLKGEIVGNIDSVIGFFALVGVRNNSFARDGVFGNLGIFGGEPVENFRSKECCHKLLLVIRSFLLILRVSGSGIGQHVFRSGSIVKNKTEFGENLGPASMARCQDPSLGEK